MDYGRGEPARGIVGAMACPRPVPLVLALPRCLHELYHLYRLYHMYRLYMCYSYFYGNFATSRHTHKSYLIAPCDTR